MKKLPITFFALLAVMFSGSSANAHHSFSMFDRSREIVIVGEVVRWGFNSPHVLLYVEDDDGTQWGLEGGAPASVRGRDPPLTGFTLRPGDRITVVYCPLRDGRSGGAIGLVFTGDETVYNPSDGGCSANERMNDWPGWIEMGFSSRAEAEEALGLDREDGNGDP